MCSLHYKAMPKTASVSRIAFAVLRKYLLEVSLMRKEQGVPEHSPLNALLPHSSAAQPWGRESLQQPQDTGGRSESSCSEVFPIHAMSCLKPPEICGFNTLFFGLFVTHDLHTCAGIFKKCKILNFIHEPTNLLWIQLSLCIWDYFSA